MQFDAKKQVNENAAQRIVRLLAKFNNEVVEEGEGDQVVAKFGGDGSGVLALEKPANQGFGQFCPFYHFTSLEQLAKYLEMGQLERLIASVLSRPA